jgi:hypothetical protein
MARHDSKDRKARRVQQGWENRGRTVRGDMASGTGPLRQDSWDKSVNIGRPDRTAWAEQIGQARTSQQQQYSSVRRAVGKIAKAEQLAQDSWDRTARTQ